MTKINPVAFLENFRPPVESDAQREAREQSDRREHERRRSGIVAAGMASIPAAYRGPSLDSVELASRVRRKQAIADTRVALESSFVVWTGLSGSGKSSLAGAAVAGLVRLNADRDVRCRYVWARAGELAVASKYSKLGDGMPDGVRVAIEADLLVIDELGSEPRSPHWQDVEDVVFARYERALPTWYTTWTDADDIAKRYGDGFARRVFERATVIDCGGGKP